MKISRLLFLSLFIFAACSTDDNEANEETGGESNSFDRKAMLANWADNIIIPAFDNFENSTQDLQDKTANFTSNPSEDNLIELRASFEKAYIDFQTVSMFEIGKAEELNYRNFLNTYPTDVISIEPKITGGTYNLALPSAYKEQGFPALDYLLNGVAENDAATVEVYAKDEYKNYLSDVSKRINDLTKEVNSSWQSTYRDNFVNNTSSSSTGSVDKFTNDYVLYFEKFLRSGKIGFPAGVFTGEPSPKNVEALYSEDLSRKLYIQSLKSVQDFFNGKSFNGVQTGVSYKQYLDYLDSMKGGEQLSGLINNQFNEIIDQATDLDANLKVQVQTDNTVMLQAFDELQKEIILLKVDMMQALSISVDYVDSDGD
ncbi:Imelysin [Gillisia sp. Hel1_33_143]|uniref:imelysin family protein n=1 Tax=Gillisia sp. Hel1_33_143 TaxID=1336796 RepID=UPI00087A4979|nr:imelysin family protein [Gillisia sp. Hel1_33_143]SDR66249.1 Imelysin [Gillisia sp. Hel1_33_143]